MRANRWLLSPSLVSAALAMLLTLAGCQQQESARPGEPLIAKVEGRPEVMLGPRTTRVLGDPTRVRAYRIQHQLAADFETLQKSKPLIQEYPILAEKPVNAADARVIAGVLLDPETYDPSFALSCLFEPRHALRFERGADVVDVILCFECGDLEIIPAAALGENRISEPFGRAAKPLYAAVSAILPN